MMPCIDSFVLLLLAVSLSIGISTNNIGSTRAIENVQSLIPLSSTSNAFQRGNKGSNIIVEFFIDLTCSSCLNSWLKHTNTFYHIILQILYLMKIGQY